jgi:hypothetical protein
MQVQAFSSNNDEIDLSFLRDEDAPQLSVAWTRGRNCFPKKPEGKMTVPTSPW